MIRFTPEAKFDLENIASTITDSSGVEVALRVIGRIEAALTPLDRFPLMGRPGRVAGTRELPIAGLPYIVVYQATLSDILIATILLGAQLWASSNR